MADSGKSERIERLEQQVNQRVRQAISGLHEEIRDRLRRAGDQIVSELDRELEGVAPDLPASFLSREELEPLTAEADSAGRHRALGDLVSALGAVDAARSQAAVLDAVVRESGRFAGRTAVLLARDSGLELWGAQGWGADASGVEVAWETSGAWSQDSLGRGVGSLDAADCAPLCSQLEEPLPAAAVLVPLVVLDRLGAVVYADRGADGELLTEALQVLTWAAALALETLPFRNREATPTLRAADEAGPALGVWSAPAASPDDVAAEETGSGDDLLAMDDGADMPDGDETADAEMPLEDLPEDAAAGWTLEDEAGDDEGAEDLAASPAVEAPRAEVGDLEVGGFEEDGEEIELEDAGLEVDELEIEDADLAETAEDAEDTHAELPRIAGFEAPAYPDASYPAAEEGGAAQAAEDDGGEIVGDDELGEVDLDSGEADGDLYPGELDDGAGASEEAAVEEAAVEEEVAEEMTADEAEVVEAEVEEPVVESGFGASPATAAVAAETEEAPVVAEQAPPPPPTGGAGQVAPPQDLQGPGSAFGGGAPSAGEQGARHEEARRLARLLVSEIRLYNEDEVEEGRRGRDIYQRLKDDIDRSRQMYEERVDPGIREETDYFYEELVRNLGDGDARTLGL